MKLKSEENSRMRQKIDELTRKLEMGDNKYNQQLNDLSYQLKVKTDEFNKLKGQFDGYMNEVQRLNGILLKKNEEIKNF